MTHLTQTNSANNSKGRLSNGTTQTKGAKLSAQWLKNLCLEEGADDAGFVEAHRLALASEKAGIDRLYPRTRSLISIVQVMNRENIQSPERYPANMEFHQTIDSLTDTARRIIKKLNARGVRGLVPTMGFPMDMDRWGEIKMWDVSHKRVAEEAGMGRMGIHRNVIHPRFGNFILLETILIDTEIDTYDRPLDYNPCLTCNLCVSVCPVDAILSDGEFDFSACLNHNYREFLGGFQDWVDAMVTADNMAGYKKRFKDTETVSMWQSLSFGANYKSAYCMAVCPAGEDIIPLFNADKKSYVDEILRPLKDKPEPIYVRPGTPAEIAVKRNKNKEVRYIQTAPPTGFYQRFSTWSPACLQP
jgi:ferredoxin